MQKFADLMERGNDITVFCDSTTQGVTASVFENTLSGNRIFTQTFIPFEGGVSNYNACEIELKGIILAGEHFQSILIGRRVNFITGNSSLQLLSNQN